MVEKTSKKTSTKTSVQRYPEENFSREQKDKISVNVSGMDLADCAEVLVAIKNSQEDLEFAIRNFKDSTIIRTALRFLIAYGNYDEQTQNFLAYSIRKEAKIS